MKIKCTLNLMMENFLIVRQTSYALRNRKGLQENTFI